MGGCPVARVRTADLFSLRAAGAHCPCQLRAENHRLQLGLAVEKQTQRLRRDVLVLSSEDNFLDTLASVVTVFTVS